MINLTEIYKTEHSLHQNKNKKNNTQSPKHKHATQPQQSPKHLILSSPPPPPGCSSPPSASSSQHPFISPPTEAAEPEPSRHMRLFLAKPGTTPLTGVCVCMVRTNPQRSVTEENVHRVSVVLIIVFPCFAGFVIFLLFFVFVFFFFLLVLYY